MTEIYHVLPNNDLHPHTMDSKGLCRCKPYFVKRLDGGDLIVHNSFDGREFFEPPNEFEPGNVRPVGN